MTVALVLSLSLSGCGYDAVCACDTGPVSEPGENLPGGETTNRLLFGRKAFTLVASNATPESESTFYAGNSFFSSAWVAAPASTGARDGLGPLFNARACGACHTEDGRGRPPLEPDEEFSGILLRIGSGELDERGAPAGDPAYGGQLQPFANPGVSGEGTPRVGWETVRGHYGDGEPYELLKPHFSIEAPAYGPLPERLAVSPRVAPQMIGLGLLEAVPEARLEELADPEDSDGDGISGRINQVWDQALGEIAFGRFGWKAEQPTVLQQTAGAFLGDMGITSRLFPDEDCSPVEVDCKRAPSGGSPEASDEVLDAVAVYSRLLAVPARERWDDPETLQGKLLFSASGCDACHVPRHETGPSDLVELQNQKIWPYTDLLLHDLGDELSDGRPSFSAEGSEWRTPPLWGIGRIPTVNGHDRLLHDGRARGVAEAILWHGGEAEAARERFRSLSSAERALLVRFVESL